MTFEANGQIVSTCHTFPFTEFAIDVRSVHQKNDRLMIEGQRMALEISPQNAMRRVPLITMVNDGKVKIALLGKPGTDVSAVLDAIFAADPSDLVPLLPPYWRRYARSHFLPPPSPLTSPVQAASAVNPAVATSAGPASAPGASPLRQNGNPVIEHVGGSVKPRLSTRFHAIGSRPR